MKKQETKSRGPLHAAFFKTLPALLDGAADENCGIEIRYDPSGVGNGEGQVEIQITGADFRESPEQEGETT